MNNQDIFEKQRNRGIRGEQYGKMVKLVEILDI